MHPLKRNGESTSHTNKRLPGTARNLQEVLLALYVDKPHNGNGNQVQILWHILYKYLIIQHNNYNVGPLSQNMFLAFFSTP